MKQASVPRAKQNAASEKKWEGKRVLISGFWHSSDANFPFTVNQWPAGTQTNVILTCAPLNCFLISCRLCWRLCDFSVFQIQPFNKLNAVEICPCSWTLKTWYSVWIFFFWTSYNFLSMLGFGCCLVGWWAAYLFTSEHEDYFSNCHWTSTFFRVRNKCLRFKKNKRPSLSSVWCV